GACCSLARSSPSFRRQGEERTKGRRSAGMSALGAKKSLHGPQYLVVPVVCSILLITPPSRARRRRPSRRDGPRGRGYPEQDDGEDLLVVPRHGSGARPPP